MATRVARYVVPHETHTATQAQYARLNCLGDESDAGIKVSEAEEARNLAAAAAYNPQAAEA
jgi:hypothetical protein